MNIHLRGAVLYYALPLISLYYTTCSSAFPIVTLEYYAEPACTSESKMGFTWDLEDFCHTFVPTLGTTAGTPDSISNPEFDGTNLTYGYHPRVTHCDEAAGANKYGSVGGCTYQTEGESYYLSIICVQTSADDPECTKWTETTYNATNAPVTTPTDAPVTAPTDAPVATPTDAPASGGAASHNMSLLAITLLLLFTF